ncbi:MAG: hypothetical protein IPK07_22900 [Deltaproteobacteria bacterium]|nr:hypothetical protein [Deltaproteobacteria bacterium]
MKRTGWGKRIGVGLVLASGLAASPGECPPPLPYPSSFVACDCHGDLFASYTGHSHIVTQTFTCNGGARDGWADIYRINYGGSSTHVGYCPFSAPGNGIPAQPCVVEDWSSGDYYTASIGVYYDGGGCGGLYNDAVDSP